MLRAALAADVALQSADDDFEDATRAAPPRGPAASGSACRVLVADDDAPTRELIADTLRKSGYDVTTAPDGQVAVELVARGGYDVVLLDAVMPRMGGVEACRIVQGLRAEPHVGQVPVALIFSKTDTRSRVEAIGIGADGYVCKPFEETELLVCVASALRTKRAHDRLRQAEHTLSRARTFDELTGAHSFVALHERLAAEFARAAKHAEPLSCCLLDVDGLKVHNERGGRSLGDRVLRAVADVIRRSIRDSDVVARYGGDEFFVMLPATHFAGSLVVASRILRDVAASVIDEEFGPQARATVSMGVALFPSRDVRTKEALIEALEASLLQAKRQGQNRLCVFQQEGFLHTPEGVGG